MKSGDVPFLNLEYRKKGETRIRLSVYYQKQDNINADGVPHYGTSVKIICVLKL